MTFASPALLGLLGLVPLAVLAYLLFQRRRPRYAARFTNLDLLASVMPHRASWRRHIPPALYLLAFAALAIALARPSATIKVPKQQGTVMLVMDVSGSMDATDVQPTRLIAAETEANHFIDELPGSFQVGVVSFSNTAQVLTPPTTDRDQARNALASLRALGGTAMGDGIERALDYARQPNGRPNGTVHDRLQAPGSGPSGGSGSSPTASSSGAASPGAASSGQPGAQGAPAGASGSQGQGSGPGGSGSGGSAAATGQPSGAGGPNGQGAGDGAAPSRAAGSPNGLGGVSNGRPMAVVLLSDGASNAGTTSPSAAAQDARQLHVPIYTIALGTANGTLTVDTGYGRRRISVPPDPETLQQVASVSGGKFFAAPSDGQLRSIYENIAQRIGFETQHQEVTLGFVAAAAALLLAGGILGTSWFHRFP